jgi:hypothetical protein
MVLTTADVYVDQALSNVSIKYTNDTFIADQMIPVLKVAKMTGVYFVYDKSNLRVDSTQRALGSPSNEVDHGVDPTGTYSCKDHALKEFTPDQIQDQADAAINPLVDSVESLTEKLLLDREVNAANLLTSSANITNYVALSGTSQWSDYTNSDPIGDIRTARTTIHQNTFKKPNTMMLGKQVYDQLCEHPQIIERVKYSQLGVITAELLARVFQLEKILIGEAGQNTAKEGQTDSLSYVWGKNVVVAYVSPQVRLKMLTLALCFTYGLRTAKRWRDEDREGTYVRIGNDNYVQAIIAAAAGYLLNTVVA